MRVGFSSDCFGATLAAPKARSAKLGSALGLGQLLLSPFRRARVAPNGSSSLSQFPEKVFHPDFKIPGNAPPLLFDSGEQSSAWRAGSPRDSEKPLDSFGTVGRFRVAGEAHERASGLA